MQEILDRLRAEGVANRRNLENAKNALEQAETAYNKAIARCQADEDAIDEYHLASPSSPQLEALNIEPDILAVLHKREINTVYALATFLKRHWRIDGLTDTQHRRLRVLLQQYREQAASGGES